MTSITSEVQISIENVISGPVKEASLVAIQLPRWPPITGGLTWGDVSRVEVGQQNIQAQAASISGALGDSVTRINQERRGYWPTPSILYASGTNGSTAWCLR